MAPHVVLDSRLAIFHETQRWLACSDLHFGHELKQRALGGLFPLWGMQDIESRLEALIAHYEPGKLILVGDIMDFAGSVQETLALVTRLSQECDVVCIAGNHDHRALQRCSGFVETHTEDGFLFHHGHRMKQMCARWGSSSNANIHVTGHLHPAHVFTDGAGFRLKVPAFVQTTTACFTSEGKDSAGCWVLPAFSPWASGTRLTPPHPGTSISAVHPTRIVTVTH